MQSIKYVKYMDYSIGGSKVYTLHMQAISVLSNGEICQMCSTNEPNNLFEMSWTEENGVILKEAITI